MATYFHRNNFININNNSLPDPLIQENFIGTVITFHEEFKLGHVHLFKDINDVDNYIKQMRMFALPLYLIPIDNDYKLTTKAPALIAEKSLVGYIYASPKELAERVNVMRLGIHAKRMAEKILEKEIERYNEYLHSTGYSYEITEKTTRKLLYKYEGFISEHEALIHAKKYIEDNLVKPNNDNRPFSNLLSRLHNK